jgi:uncharacterized membrane protein YvlD (DUF360 family)
MKAFLHMKALPVFFLTTGAALIIAAVYLTLVILENPLADKLEAPLTYVATFTLVINFLWVYTLGTSLQEKVPDDLKHDLKRFKGTFWTAAVLSAIEVVVDELESGGILYLSPQQKLSYYFPIRIGAIVCRIANDVFIARQLSSIQFQRQVTFGDYSANFFALLFNFIGVFWIQPKVNKIFDEETGAAPGGPIDQGL